MAGLPPRIWIVGPSGAGKSTLADVLAARLGVPATHVDDLHHRPGWTEAPPDELVAAVDRATSGPVWVVDGNYRKVTGSLRARADLVVWLDLPLYVTVPRAVRRSVRRLVTGELCCNGNRETIRGAFLSRDSVLAWSVTRHGELRRALEAELADRPHVRLRSVREVATWLVGAEASPESKTARTLVASGPSGN